MTNKRVSTFAIESLVILQVNKDEEIGKARAMKVGDIQSELTKVQTLALKAIEQAGPEMDTSKITCLKFDEKESSEFKELQAMNDMCTIYAVVLDEKLDTERMKKNILHEASEHAETDLAKYGAEAYLPFEIQSRAKGIGDMFVESAEYRAALEGGNGNWQTTSVNCSLDTAAMAMIGRSDPQAAVFKRDAGWEPQIVRSGRVQLSDQRPVQLLDLLPIIRISTSGYSFMEETTFTNNVSAKAEGASLVESALVLTEKSAKVEKLGTYIAVTDEQLMDQMGARDYLNMRIPDMVRQEVDKQVLQGTGVTPNIQGLYTLASALGQAKTAAITLLDTYLKARTLIRKNVYMAPNAVLVSPDEYERLLLQKDADGRYLFGSPFTMGERTVWGIRIVENDALTANTAFMGAFSSQCALIMREDVQLQVGLIADQFIQNVRTVKAYMRCAMVAFRPKAFCKLTALETADS